MNVSNQPSPEALRLADDIHEFLGGNPDEWEDKGNRVEIAKMIEEFAWQRQRTSINLTKPELTVILDILDNQADHVWQGIADEQGEAAVDALETGISKLQDARDTLGPS